MSLAGFIPDSDAASKCWHEGRLMSPQGGCNARPGAATTVAAPPAGTAKVRFPAWQKSVLHSWGACPCSS